MNCQVEGEHPNCGSIYNEGLDKNGFSYSNIELEKNGIHVLYCGWIYFTPKSYNHMIKIVKEMYYYIHTLNKKVIDTVMLGWEELELFWLVIKYLKKK